MRNNTDQFNKILTIITSFSNIISAMTLKDQQLFDTHIKMTKRHVEELMTEIENEHKLDIDLNAVHNAQAELRNEMISSNTEMPQIIAKIIYAKTIHDLSCPIESDATETGISVAIDIQEIYNTLVPMPVVLDAIKQIKL